MSKRRLGALFLFLLFAAAPFAFAIEEWPPDGYSRTVVYWAGTCNSGTMTYNGHVEFGCAPEYDIYGQGARSGKWRHKLDESCIYPGTSYSKYEVCISGSSCTANSGTWQEITQAQFLATYCP